MAAPYPKRLIEVDLPIREISAHARREKSIRHGHISTLHIWWARRPLAACRAVICAALWPDPGDDLCPHEFRAAAANALGTFADRVRNDKGLAALCQAHWQRWNRTTEAGLDPTNPAKWYDMRYALLDFISDFANWDASTVPAFLEASRALTQAAHEALGGAPGTRPLVVDPFAGGGSIPLEALRVGADTFASDLNPVAVLLNKVVLEYLPKYGNAEITMADAEGEQRTFRGLVEAVRYWGGWVKEQAEKELAEFYPVDPDGATPIAYLWARTIQCEGPQCGVQIPLIRSLWLAKKGEQSVALRMCTAAMDAANRTSAKVPIHFEILAGVKARQVGEGTVKRGSATCPACSFTTPASAVRAQLAVRQGGTADACAVATVARHPGGKTFYRPSSTQDAVIIQSVLARLAVLPAAPDGSLGFVPDEKLPYLRSVFNINLLGVSRWGDLFAPRQRLLLTTVSRIVRSVAASWPQDHLHEALVTLLAFLVDKVADFQSSLTQWISVGEKLGHTFGRQALGIVWDYAEGNPLADISGSWDRCVKYMCEVIEHEAGGKTAGTVRQASATTCQLPDDSVAAIVTDPPYYDMVPYADLSDFFYVWLRRSLGPFHGELFSSHLTPKEPEIVQLAERNPEYAYKTRERYETLMTDSMREARRALNPSGLGVVVFAHKETQAWETELQSMLDAGWVITASWPIDTERGGRLRSFSSAVLSSSVHLSCRPRENPDGSLRTDDVASWREVLGELPRRIHEWMPRLAAEGVVGADAIFACLGPALEIFSRYSRVEKASGDVVTLREYLEHVWAAVAREALTMIFHGADASGFEEDARLTAIWLWTLSTAQGRDDVSSQVTQALNREDESGSDDEDETGAKKPAKPRGFALEYDAARKIAQGLGAHLEELTNLVEVRGDTARLLPVEERAARLIGAHREAPPARGRGGKQLSFADLDSESQAADKGWAVEEHFPAGESVLDRVHQGMLLFASGRSDILRRLLVDEGAGRDERFWRLAQALSALYPSVCDEKRWVDGLLARKKGLGF